MNSIEQGKMELVDLDAEEINQLHDEFCVSVKTTIDLAIKIGGKLLAKKQKIKAGGPRTRWLPWVKGNLKFSRKTAAQYIRCFVNSSRKCNLGVTFSSVVELAQASEKPVKEENDGELMPDSPEPWTPTRQKSRDRYETRMEERERRPSKNETSLTASCVMQLGQVWDSIKTKCPEEQQVDIAMQFINYLLNEYPALKGERDFHIVE